MQLRLLKNRTNLQNGSLAFGSAWLFTAGITLGWKISHGGYEIRIHRFLVILTTILFTPVMARFGKSFNRSLLSYNASYLYSHTLKMTVIAGLLWSFVWSIATYIGIFIWLKPSVRFSAIQNPVFWRMYPSYPGLFLSFIIPAFILGFILLSTLDRSTEKGEAD